MFWFSHQTWNNEDDNQDNTQNDHYNNTNSVYFSAPRGSPRPPIPPAMVSNNIIITGNNISMESDNIVMESNNVTYTV